MDEAQALLTAPAYRLIPVRLVDLVIRSLGQLPYGEVAPIIGKLQALEEPQFLEEEQPAQLLGDLIPEAFEPASEEIKDA